MINLKTPIHKNKIIWIRNKKYLFILSHQNHKIILSTIFKINNSAKHLQLKKLKINHSNLESITLKEILI